MRGWKTGPETQGELTLATPPEVMGHPAWRLSVPSKTGPLFPCLGPGGLTLHIAAHGNYERFGSFFDSLFLVNCASGNLWTRRSTKWLNYEDVNLKKLAKDYLLHGSENCQFYNFMLKAHLSSLYHILTTIKKLQCILICGYIRVKLCQEWYVSTLTWWQRLKCYKLYFCALKQFIMFFKNVW